ncbi:MAG TPA: DGQHR domain-containing protein [Terriglobales bacterium]|nr:DGQHR domain-containing protein [Terriglobales bacterium]
MADIPTTPAFPVLRVPALKAHMGDWIYYAAFLKLADISQRVFLAEEIHKHEGLRDMIQRSIDYSGHAESIKQYLLEKPQRFFNALVIGVYGGEPNFFELELHRGPRLNPADLPNYFTGALGILQFNGMEKLFAIDGQHRVKGIKLAMETSTTLGDEEVIVLFVPHSRSTDGMERSRRLFTTLNRYAKPVSKMDIIALDEDDIVAIVTRMLVEEYPLFKNFLKIKKGKQLQASDTESFTTIETLYDALDTYLSHQDAWNDFKRTRPSDAKIKQYYRRAVELWDTVQTYFPAVKTLAESDKGAEAAAEFRGAQGGHLLFRPVGLLLVIDVIHEFLQRGKRLLATVRALAKAPMELAEVPWNELLWNPAAHRMITAPENRKVAMQILYHGIGGNLEDINTSAAAVREEWAGVVNRDPSAVHLRRW